MDPIAQTILMIMAIVVSIVAFLFCWVKGCDSCHLAVRGGSWVVLWPEMQRASFSL